MMRRISVVAMGAVLACSVSAWGQTAASVEKDIIRSTGAERLPPGTMGVEESAGQLLRRRVDSVDWRETPFEAVVDWLREQGEGRVNVLVRWTPMQVESIGRETPINLQLNSTTVANVLNEVVKQLADDSPVQYRGIGNTLTISTKADFERKMYVRIYDVTDLLFRVPDMGQSAPRIDLQNAGQRGGSGGSGGGGQSVFQGSGGSGGEERGMSVQQEEQENTQRLERLRQIIEQTIAPETWDLTGSTGGAGGGGGQQAGRVGGGRIRVYNRSLIILNSIEVHELISGAFVE